MAVAGGSESTRIGSAIPPRRSSTPSMTVATANMSQPVACMIFAHSTAPWP